jgi:hypothetical protein
MCVRERESNLESVPVNPESDEDDIFIVFVYVVFNDPVVKTLY